MLKRLYHRIWTNAFCPFYLRLNPFKKMTEMQKLHGWASAQYFSSYPFLVNFTLRCMMLSVWPIRLSSLIYQAMGKYAKGIIQSTHKPYYQQVKELYYYGMFHLILPLDYYRYGLYLKKDDAWISALIQQHEVFPLTYKLNSRSISQQQQMIMKDKRLFHNFCLKHDLITPHILAILPNNGALFKEGLIFKDPSCSFFIKPQQGARGEGSVLMKYVSQGVYETLSGEKMTWKVLLKQLQILLDEGNFIVQPLLENHAAIEKISLGALSILRVLTAMNDDGAVEVVAATFNMAGKQHQIVSVNGLYSAVDMSTGMLGCAMRYGDLEALQSIHPITGSRIDGVILPYWAEALGIAKTAHEKLHAFSFVGWDVAITPTGVNLLEGNVGWDVNIVQRPQGQPLGLTQTFNTYF